MLVTKIGGWKGTVTWTLAGTSTYVDDMGSSTWTVSGDGEMKIAPGATPSSPLVESVPAAPQIHTAARPASAFDKRFR